MSEERKADLRAFMAANTIGTLMARGCPPKVGSVELDQNLRFTSTGPYSVWDTLRHGGHSVSSVGHREMSRYATKVAEERLGKVLGVEDLTLGMRRFGDVAGTLPLTYRKLFTDTLDVITRNYMPRESHKNLTIWFWDEDVKSNLCGFLSKAGLPSGLVFGLVAGALADLDLGEERQRDLNNEYRRVMLYIKLVSSITDLFTVEMEGGEIG